MKKTILFKAGILLLLALSALPLQAFDDCAGLTAQAMKQLEKGNLPNAYRLCLEASKATRGADGICESSIALGKYYIACKDYDAAERAFLTLLNMENMARRKHCFALYRELIKLHMLTGNKSQLEKNMQAILPYAGDNITQIFRAGQKCYYAKEYPLAEALLLKAATFPGSLSAVPVIDTWKTLARNAFDSGNPEKAYQYLKQFQAKENCSGYPFEEMERVRWEFLCKQKRYQEALDTSLALASTTQISLFKTEAFSRAAMVTFRHFNDIVKAKEYIDQAVAVKDSRWLDEAVQQEINDALKKLVPEK